MKITFCGAARTVTGSCHLVEADGKKFLIDCGMFQGTLQEQMLNYEPFPFNVSEIDFVILTHAHIDHSGRIPKLYLEGYKGPIYATKATCDLAAIMLPDSGHIQEREIEWVNRKRTRAGKSETKPLYTAEEASQCLKYFKPLEYDETNKLTNNIKFKFIEAGHMLGSAIIEMFITEDGKEQRVVFTGDLGNKNMPILKDPEYIKNIDTLVIESTYGDRTHGDLENQSLEFLSIVLDTIDRGGNVIIPSFAVGRTQELLYEINKNLDLYGDKIKRLNEIPVYVDSPLAVSATEIFKQNGECFDAETLGYLISGNNPFEFKNLHFVRSAEESKALNEDKIPKVIISASGMCEVGRIKHHLKHNLWRPECTVVFVGYQAEGTLGRKIVSGDKLVKIYGEEIGVNAQIIHLDSFSGHADKAGLLDWIENIDEKPKNVFIVHGEYDAQVEFAHELKRKFDLKTQIPELNQTYEIIDGVIQNIDVMNKDYKSDRLELIEMLSMLKEDVVVLTNRIKKDITPDSDPNEIKRLKGRVESLKELINTMK